MPDQQTYSKGRYWLALQQAKAVTRACHHFAALALELAELKYQYAENQYRCTQAARTALMEGRAQDALEALELLEPPVRIALELPALPPSFLSDPSER